MELNVKLDKKPESEEYLLAVIRDWSNRNLFSCKQVDELLSRFQTDDGRVQVIMPHASQPGI